MKRACLTHGLLVPLALAAAGGPVAAEPRSSIEIGDSAGGGTARSPYLQCVPYARQVSGIRIFGDAHTWWGQAEGRYARGYRPKVGAVMAFKPHGSSSLGHVAAVSRIVDSRTVLVRHANWSPINGRRGQIEDNVKVVDVSPANDWSEVRVWYAPIGNLGGSHWPVQGFIYKAKRGKEAPRAAAPAQTLQPSGRNSDPIGEIIKARLGF